MAESGIDRRRAHRFKGDIPVRLQEGTGITRDFSASGIYFYTDHLLPVGESFEFTYTLDCLGEAKPVYIHCTGNVLRVDQEPERYGVAARLTAHTFGEFGGFPAQSQSAWDM